MKGKLALFVFSLLAVQMANAQPVVAKGDWTKKLTADHSKFEILNREFTDGREVTEACLSCHTEASKQIHQTFHWKWGAEINGKKVGKGQNAFNNFCMGNEGNEPKCASCHIGYGYTDKYFDFDSEESVDCLVCHDTTATYLKADGGSGHPNYADIPEKGIKKVDLKFVAQNVGKPNRHNCLQCHANGGGGNGVKHGDTDTSLINPAHELDVHMNADGLNFACQDCHTTREHKIAGRYYGGKAFTDFEKNMGRRDREGETLSCQQCHGEKPHHDTRLNNHTDKVACASCHIPYFARGGIATKTSWDWSTAGKDTEGKWIKDTNGKPMKTEGHPMDDMKGEKDTSISVHDYVAIKGDFTWKVNGKPEYFWYKGELSQLTWADKIDPSKAPVVISGPSGGYNDEMAKIWPFKVHRGKQPYDTEHLTFLPAKVFGPKGSGAFWSDYNWEVALKLGSEYTGVPYSGKFDFVPTETYWVIKHMVAPEEKAVSCAECHNREGRLKDVPGFYMVGRDRNKALDIVGILLVFGALFGVLGHGLLRIMKKK